MVLISLVSLLNLLYFYINTFRSVCAVPSMAVFCSSLTSCFSCMLLTYFLNDFEIVPVAPIITGITFVFTFHMRCISIVRSLYFRILSASFLITFLFPEIVTSINAHLLLLLFLEVTTPAILLYGNLPVSTAQTTVFHDPIEHPCAAYVVDSCMFEAHWSLYVPCAVTMSNSQLCTRCIFAFHFDLTLNTEPVHYSR